MMKTSCLLLMVCLSLRLIAQQGSAIPDNVRAVNTIEQLTFNSNYSTNEKMYGIAIPEGKVIGDTYLNPRWTKSAILLYEGDKLIKNYEVRYDIMSDALIIRTPAGLRSLSGNLVKSFTWIDSTNSQPAYFVNAKSYEYEGSTLIGFFEVLADGKTPLFKRTTLSIKKADYNVALAVGSKDDKIFKKPTYYYSIGDRITEVPTSKKKLLSIFGKHTKEMEVFMDRERLSLKKESDIQRAFEHYNTLIK